jgi:hypothetical protein
MGRALQISLALAVAGCGHPDVPPRVLDTGDVVNRPSVQVLPLDRPERPLSRRMQFALALAEQSLSVSPPPLPPGRSAREIERWTSETLRPWVAEKSHAVEVARAELDAAADETHGQLIMAGALVGLLYEDVARHLAAVPLPDDLIGEPEIAAIYRDVVDFHVSPWREHARRAYLACAQNAIQPPSMRGWSAFCAGRAERLPPPRAVAIPAGTRVTVSFDPALVE